MVFGSSTHCSFDHTLLVKTFMKENFRSTSENAKNDGMCVQSEGWFLKEDYGTVSFTVYLFPLFAL